MSQTQHLLYLSDFSLTKRFLEMLLIKYFSRYFLYYIIIYIQCHVKCKKNFLWLITSDLNNDQLQLENMTKSILIFKKDLLNSSFILLFLQPLL